jgi:hypothetical protein
VHICQILESNFSKSMKNTKKGLAIILTSPKDKSEKE